MRLRHLMIALSVVAVVAVMVGLSRVADLTDEPAPEHVGVTAVGLGEDDTLLARTQMCGDRGPAGDVMITWGTPNEPGDALVISLDAAPVVEVPDIFEDPYLRTTVRVRAGKTEPVWVTPAEWEAVAADRWIVTEPGADGDENLTLTEQELLDWAC